MAGDWIAIDHDFPEKEEVIAICAKSGASVAETMLALFRLWRWADRHTEDGRLRNVSVTGVTLLCGQSDAFWHAVESVGWIEIDGDDIVVPRFAHRFGESARSRMLGTKRMQRFRGKKSKAKKRHKSVTGVTPSASRKRSPQPQPHVSPNGDTTPTPLQLEFTEAWEDWLKHRQEIGHPLKPTAAMNALKKLADMGEPRAIAAIRHSIANGWQGLFEPKEDSYRGRTLFPPAENPARPRDAELGPDRYPPGCSPTDTPPAGADAAEANGKEHG